MKNELSPQQKELILLALNKLIKAGPWDESNFLRLIGKKLNQTRDEFALKAQIPEHAELKSTLNFANRVAPQQNQREIFISLYSADGSNLRSWERILSNLPSQIISRPIYADETSIKAFIKTKENPVNEAYVALYIDAQDILSLPPDKIYFDKLNQTLLALKDRALNVDNINKFAHGSDCYLYTCGRLLQASNRIAIK